MKKFLNFSTILCSYVLITLLVISCGGSSGGGGGTGGSAGSSNSDGTSGGDGSDGNDGTSGGDGTDVNDGSSGGDGSDGSGGLTQPEPKDTCLLPDRADKDSFIAILCSEGVVIGKIKLPSSDERQNVNFLIPSTANAGVPGRIWEIPETGEIQISYSKDYNVTLDAPTGDYYQSFPIGVTIAEADGHTAESPLKILTMPSLIDSSKRDYNNRAYNRLMRGDIYFMPALAGTTDSIIEVYIAVRLAVKTQEDFISMANFTTIFNLGYVGNPLSYALENDLDLIAPGGEDAKFNNAIIPVADATFALNGLARTINLKSAIDTTASENPAAIIGKVTKGLEFYDVTFNINAPISGRGNVGAIVGYGEEGAVSDITRSKVNINRNITVYKSADNENGYVGGLVGSGPARIYDSVVKTGDGAVIQAFAQNNATQNFAPAIGGLIGKIHLRGSMQHNVVDVTLGAETSDDGFAGNFISLGGLAGVLYDSVNSYGNLIKLAISRGNLPADFSFDNVAGLVAQIQDFRDFANNLVYADFSNLGKVNFLGGLLGKIQGWGSDIISNNMIFIADSFTGSDVQTSFGAAIALYDQTIDIAGLVLNIDNNFVSSPFTDNDYTTNAKLASFVHTANKDINFNNLILDNTLSTVMFKEGDEVANLQGKVGGTNGGPLFTLADAKITPIYNLFTADSSTNTITNTISWEVGSEGYPQLKVQTYSSYLYNYFTKSDIEQAWTETNADIQTGLAARAARASQ